MKEPLCYCTNCETILVDNILADNCFEADGTEPKLIEHFDKEADDYMAVCPNCFSYKHIMDIDSQEHLDELRTKSKKD